MYLLKDKELKLVIQGSAVAILIVFTLSNLSKASVILMGLSVFAIIWQIISLYMHSLALSKSSSLVRVPTKGTHEFIKDLY